MVERYDDAHIIGTVLTPQENQHYYASEAVHIRSYCSGSRRWLIRRAVFVSCSKFDDISNLGAVVPMLQLMNEREW
jgi:hypothetical protein